MTGDYVLRVSLDSLAMVWIRCTSCKSIVESEIGKVAAAAGRQCPSCGKPYPGELVGAISALKQAQDSLAALQGKAEAGVAVQVPLAKMGLGARPA